LGEATSARYGALWEQRSGPPVEARYGVTAQQYKQTFDQPAARGFRRIAISGYAD
jgi:hypothetical protein